MIRYSTTGRPTVKIRYRRLRRSRLISAWVSSSMPRIFLVSSLTGAGRGSGVAGRVVLGGDGEERLLRTEAADLDLARPVAGVEHPVQGRVGVGGLDLHVVVPGLHAGHAGEPE